MKKYINTLKLSRLFGGIKENEIEEVLLLLSAVKKEFGKNEYIFRYKHSTSVYIIGFLIHSV